MVPIQAAHLTKINQQLEADRKGSSPWIFVDQNNAPRSWNPQWQSRAATTVG
jgi:hypothetical protein